MKKILFLLLGIVIISNSCQTNTELTDADKDAIVQAVKKASQQYYSAFGGTYNDETVNTMKGLTDLNSESTWQTDPIVFVANVGVVNKQDDYWNMVESVIESRIATNIKTSEIYYSVLSKDKVLEVIKGDGNVVSKDSSMNAFNYVNTSIWANVDGEWKLEFCHQSAEF